MRRTVLARRWPASLVALVLVAGCSGGVAGSGRFADGPPGPGTGSAAPGDGGDACPAAHREPDPNRPSIRLTFDLSDDGATVTGTEHVEFTPDLAVTELVFRLTANTPPTADAGSSIEVTSATADPAGDRYRVDKAGAAAGTQGGLLRIPLGAEVPAGRKVTADLAFTLRLGAGAFDRIGRDDGYAWWGSGQPLLAWERGVGWHTEPLLDFVGESATSEAARIDLTVTAPGDLTVLAGGTPEEPTTADRGRKRWHATADRARDISVSVGRFAVKDGTVAGTRLIVGAAEGRSPDALYAEHARAITELTKHFGAFPYPVLSVARLPVGGGGIEYPGSILMLDDSREVAVHETAHMYFYGMVGDSQARDPWLDEAFASYAEGLVDGGLSTGGLDEPGRVGGPMTAFGSDADYFRIVYGKGEAALAAARQAAGPAAFDKALTCYVNANAWRIARPADLARALAGLPRAVDVLTKAGALP